MIETDFENLVQGFPEEPSPAEEELIHMLRTLYRQAQAWKADKVKKFALWRSLFEMAPPESPNPKVPTVATPVVRQKADGIRAHIKVSLDRTPFFTLRPLTSEAADAAPALESIMQR